ncbi:DNA-binding response regulator, OmpR family, contains REC and winged-helix (wHTH) domain [Catalinimonas alkaloidigena]|uniref:DNA-binding response regulator, OmpR family, contains REC and winged-helix (WHTH) domain n=1 Tax=Catalinimonas alkaloidigena TaxID=1075417 RepID=A0A1G9ABA1_9BACT|nr:response regulator transcription factor [Catalinimonas alkaloidigena]SDK24114.1 DNA-binding response regulator, OmpR family, contains REC and winged-helix (wHTH) domain [Catalinimonas alkaloidigena]
MKVLIVEDNRELATNIQEFLSGEQYRCEVCFSYHDAQTKLVAFPYDCVVLDLTLPDGDGLQLLRLMQREKIKSGVLIISARNALDDRITGLDLGADDYLTKPFHLPELHARLKAIYRRKQLDGDTLVQFKELSINTQTSEARVHDTPLALTRKELELLLFFLINKNRVLTRQTIAEHLWGDYTENLDNFNFVYQHVKNLRRKISEAEGQDYIETVYGYGYKFNTYL